MVSEISKKSILIIIAAFVVVVAVIAELSFAWFIHYRNDVIFITGDTKISVTGEYKIALADVKDDEDWREFNFTADNNPFEGISATQNIYFKFEIKNETSNKAANVSIRFSDLTENIFKEFDGNDLTAASKERISAEASKNTAKLAYIINNAYYETPKEGGGNPEISELFGSDFESETPTDDKYVWQHASGSRFIENVHIEPEQTVTLYFQLQNKPTIETLEAYKQWLLGDSETIGFGQERCANLLGTSWADSVKKEIINAYLNYFSSEELKSMSGDDDISTMSLHIDYFEFIGENAR